MTESVTDKVVDKISDNSLTDSVLHAGNWLSDNQDLLIQYAVNLVSALLILFIGNMIVKAVAGAVAKVLRKKDMDNAVVEFIHGLVRYLLFVIVLIAALSRIGVQTASVVAVIGAAGLAVGLALQGSLSNFAAGVLIVAFRPFKSGDFVEVAGVSGAVESIQIFSTELRTPDNKTVVVPNSSIIGNPITNYSRNATRRIDLVIGVSYSADLQKTKEVLKRVVNADERVLKDPEPTIGVVALADSSVNFVVRPWVNTPDYWAVYFDLNQAIKEELDKEGIEIPFPQMDVHLNKVDA
ncbi:small-conductance mechanosensitive channel MscS [Photobacterium leiognathi]|uniref:Small-conductance mechanosensitive channel n=3 Tax=Photobacterium leiognathi TaxID=553611 RepID=A0A0U1P851_PHOLE|nr:small-conductance mechanosensitive channel MscS [Photobacterium leiognathi]KJF89886.1 mechanosensitive ion channel protein [Photobacterium leiognathi]KJF98539.1 mechanosensitive ion channel protein [Photobacterium leiognathi]MCG3883148.1 small-conductance mechanosensitive channel MscS [Photobacterium leiognathi]PSU98572.1 mechanosensitive ion channel protein [Photobacterium leiognathi subsp. mandapamensis]PSV12137.1 mechanosensitive ion channel protein [Photobacterium leiognathi subsp. mand